MHIGHHNYPPRSVPMRESMKMVALAVKKHYDISPSSNPTRIKNLAVGKLMSQFEMDGEISKEIKTKLWDSLKVVSTP